ncbi:rhomboid domain-containing protein 2 [Ambystoma mexicanum]|uniref:rhomboid domain-containing protein 2 n=1 Tax=Ambystoma mexicanum TaxID=8296 RepID=UPI0037E97FAD
MDPPAPAATLGWTRTLLCCPRPQPSTGVLLTVLACLAASAPTLLRTSSGALEDTASCLDLDPGTVASLSDVHRLVTYAFYHEDWNSLLCSYLIIWYFGGGFEQSVGTVKHCFLTLVFTVSSSLLYLALHAGATTFGLEKKEHVQGFTTVVFAMISAFTISSRLRRVLFMGFLIPTKVLPLVFLAVSLFLPHASFLSNLCGILVGIAYGLGGCSFLDLSEPVVTKLDQKFPFNVMRRIPAVKYVPGSTAERRASQNRKLNPPPGPYPTQQYYPYPAQGLPGPSIIPGLGHSHVPNQHHHGPPSYQSGAPHGAVHVPSSMPAPQGHCCNHSHINSSAGGYPSGTWAVPMSGHAEVMQHHHAVPQLAESTQPPFGLLGVETR